MSRLDIRQVSVDVIRPLRHAVLRTGRPYSTTLYAHDLEENAVHFAGFDDDAVVSIATIFPSPCPVVEMLPAYRLRGMATRKDLRHQGWGNAILEHVVDYLRKETDADLLWCETREVAFDFYRKYGFELVGDPFEIPLIGTHRIGLYYLQR